jgi:hypothetical protein
MAVEAWEAEGGAVVEPAVPREGSAEGDVLASFSVSAVLLYTARRPRTWTAHDEAEYVRANTVVGRHPLDGVEVTYFAPAGPERRRG